MLRNAQRKTVREEQHILLLSTGDNRAAFFPVPGLQPLMTWELNRGPARLHLINGIKSQDSPCKVHRRRYH